MKFIAHINIMPQKALLDPQGKIYFVAIDLLASPAELLQFRR